MKKLLKVDLNIINGSMQQSIGHDLGLKVTEIGDDYMLMEMPVTKKSHQPMGLLHGGVSAYIIETIGSVASSLLVDLNKEHPVGLEINANHVKGIKTGIIEARAKLVHGGRRTHLWQVDIHNKDNRDLICTGRLTVMIVSH
jgi:1,4-dihydroxy-2-naphthoyl-CoA hydrolase